METQDINKIKKYIEDKLVNDNTVIAIDGCDGAGKTTLGAAIAASLKIKHIDLDDYLIKKQGSFVNCIKNDQLKFDIDAMLTDGSVVVSGVCLLDVLTRLETEPDILIYTKRYDQSGMYWQDEEDCEIIGDPFEKLNKTAKRWNELGIFGDKCPENRTDYKYRIEVMSYHQEYTPHKKADIIYRRVEK